MRYKSATTLLFFVLAFIFILLLLILKGDYWYFLIIPFIVCVVGLLAFKSPIDRYFFKYQEVGFVDKIQAMLKIEYPIIETFSPEKQKEFYDRLFYFMYERNSYLVTEETEDLEMLHSLIICAPGVILSMEGKKDEGKDIQRIAAYKHPFPSPKMKFLHAAEYDEEDGVIIVSLEQMIMSQRNPESYFPITYFMWAERKVAVSGGFPTVPKGFDEKFQELWGFTQKSAESFMGYELRNLPAMAICAYMLRRENLDALFPGFSSEIKNYLRA